MAITVKPLNKGHFGDGPVVPQLSEQSATEQSATEQSATEQSATEQIAAEQHSTKQHPAELCACQAMCH